MLFFWVLGGYTPQGATPTQVGFTAKGAFAFTTFYEKSLRVFLLAGIIFAVTVGTLDSVPVRS
jgi:hypothetical protein